MGKYFIEEVKCGCSNGGMACGPVSGTVNVALKFTKDGVTKWLTNSEYGGIPNFYLTDESIFEKLIEDDLDDDFVDFMSRSFIDEFDGIKLGEYDEIEESLNENQENPAVDLIEYIVELTRCDDEDVDAYIEAATGKYANEVNVFSGEVLDFASMNEEEIFLNRLYIEANDEKSYVFKDMDADMQKQIRRDLRNVIAACPDGYEEWKKSFLESNMEELKGTKMITCRYMFAGIGSYTETMPEDKLDGFKRWIDGNGSAFLGEVREATADEIKSYIALCVFDE